MDPADLKRFRTLQEYLTPDELPLLSKPASPGFGREASAV